MTADVTRLIAYYKSPLGRISRALVREQVTGLADDVAGKRVLGLGFATPYLRFTLDKAERVLGYAPKYSNKDALVRNYEWYIAHLAQFEHASGVSHRVPWKQGILKLAKLVF